jgi:DNA-directed RNA polymerase
MLTWWSQRVEEFGYDRDDRQYYLLDDNRFYRRTDPPLPAGPKAKPKANSKKAIAARRRESKRRKIESETPEVDDGDHEGDGAVEETQLDPAAVDTLGGYKWECVAITLPDYHELCESLKKAKDPNEKALRERLVEEVIPIIEAAEEKQRRKIERRERELMMMERMVGAKRSGRLADKHDRERREAEQAEAERKRKADLAAARLEQERQEKMEEERRYRMMTREQRIKDREFKRLLKEEELARDELEQKRIEEGQVRGSERHVRERMERNKKELEELAAEDEWTFDCSGCGKYGKNLVSSIAHTT